MAEMTNVQAIKAFFEADNGRKLTMDELKALTPAERKELAEMAAKVLNVTLTVSK